MTPFNIWINGNDQVENVNDGFALLRSVDDQLLAAM